MKLKFIFPVLTVFMIVFIWAHSLMPGEISSSESGMLSGIFAKIMHMDPEAAEVFVRKTAHFTEFMILGILVTLDTFFLFGHQFSSTGVTIGLFVPAIDETLQMFTFGRNGSLLDVWLDFFGYITGLICCCIICRIIKKE